MPATKRNLTKSMFIFTATPPNTKPTEVAQKRGNGKTNKSKHRRENIPAPLLLPINSTQKSNPGKEGEGKRAVAREGEGERGEGEPRKALFFFFLLLSNFILRPLDSPPRPVPGFLERGAQEEQMGREERFPVWEAALGAGVAAAFAAGLVGVYLSMPDSDYSFLKLPRDLQELQILT
jgi:hypothetical protein